MYRHFLKRILDLLAALAGLVLLSPLLLVVGLLLTMANGGTPFFTQERPGKHGRLFRILKFKTMRDFDPHRDTDVHSPNRITPVGAFVRRYSLDELLQLVNVLKGDMSLVGPRPLLPEYLPLYNSTQEKRHRVRPGITGWAQVNGRNAISWEEKFAYDVWYVENLGFLLDLKILIRTFIKVFRKEDVNQSGNTIMPVWQGNPTD
ncbi:sugar transferase [Robiginitalea sp. M366]|uniref:sugar transferase n=1 Tax=Robiginitalea aestuariiviva TaxID=3036903 RepID=UPI00240D7B1D|nr:sugar transferase [Robiginitalea aestuariiviva]MDG1572722.1 sugar transferase [Robiginitalea aestuariiviva]